MKVSVIIPTYNLSEYISDAIESILNQNFKDFEIIVVDDGGTDTTKEVLLPYIKKNQVCYIYQKNQGVAGARNTGIHYAKGEYLCFLDADDTLLENSFRKRVDFLNRFSEVGLVFSDHRREYDKSHSLDCILRKNSFIDFCEESIEFNEGEFFIFNNIFLLKFLSFDIWPAHTSTVMIRNKIIDNIGYFNTAIPNCDDIDFFVRIIMKYKIGFINDQLGCYKKQRSRLTANIGHCYKSGVAYRKRLFHTEKYEKYLPKLRVTELLKSLKSKISQDYNILGRYYLKRLEVFNAVKFYLLSAIYYF